METGNIGFMLLATSLVMLMTPGLAFFYGGLVTKRNILAIMIQSFVSLGITTILWFAFGYSLCFSGDGAIIGNFHVSDVRVLSPLLLKRAGERGAQRGGGAGRCAVPRQAGG